LMILIEAMTKSTARINNVGNTSNIVHLLCVVE